MANFTKKDLSEHVSIATGLTQVDAKIVIDSFYRSTEAKEQMKTDFKNLANTILEEESIKFTEQNKEKLDGILTPLR